VDVAILIPSNAQERFPLRCDHVESIPQDYYGQLCALNETTKSPSWNNPALRRVQVYRMASVRDVVEYLLSVQGKPPNQQPLGGIVVDDVDCFARGIVNSGEQTSGEITTEQLMTMTHIRKY
jgi:lipase chaperone LimK